MTHLLGLNSGVVTENPLIDVLATSGYLRMQNVAASADRVFLGRYNSGNNEGFIQLNDGSGMAFAADHNRVYAKGGLEHNGYTRWGGDISVSLTANQNNWAPTGIDTATIVKVTPDAVREVTGLTVGSVSEGHIIVLQNISTVHDIVLKHSSASSLSTRRFRLPNAQDFRIHPEQCAAFIFDPLVSSPWRMLWSSTGISATYYATAASGNLTSTTLNAALAELQTDIDTRQKRQVSGTLDSLPKTGLQTDDIYEPTDGLFRYRYNGSQWQPLTPSGMPFGAGLSGTEPLTNLCTPTYRWTLTGSGTNEYACELAAGGNPSLTQPQNVFIGGSLATIGTAGSLAAGRWAWGIYSGFSTVIVRLSDGTDPDTKGYGHIRSSVYTTLTSAGLSTATVDKGHYFLATTAAASVPYMYGQHRTTPGTPWTYLAAVRPFPTGFGFSGNGISVTDGVRQFGMVIVSTNGSIQISKYGTTTTFTSDSYIGEAAGFMRNEVTYLAIRDTGTNIEFYVGNYPHLSYMRLLVSEARATFLTSIATTSRVGPCVLTFDQPAAAWYPYAEFI